MGVRPTSIRELSDTLSLSEFPATCGDAFKAGYVNRITGEKLSKPGFWLYDKTRGMNLSMRAESPESALIEGLTYYQTRTQSLEKELEELKVKVNSFIDQFKVWDGEGNCEVEV